MSAGPAPGIEMVATLLTHRRRQASELRRFAISLGHHPHAPLIHAQADRLEAIVLLCGASIMSSRLKLRKFALPRPNFVYGSQTSDCVCRVTSECKSPPLNADDERHYIAVVLRALS
jgi:hypothetical protein